MKIRRLQKTVACDEGSFSAYCAIPDQPRSVGILVLQEIFGVNENIRQIVDGFAEQGFAAIAPDLYWRIDPDVELDPASEAGRSRAMVLMASLDREEAVRDGAAALSALGEMVGGFGRTAAIGYCFGGGVAYLMAVRNYIDAGIAYYGTGLGSMLAEAGNLRGNLLLHLAGEDHLCPVEVQEKIKSAMAPLGSKASVILHEGVGHAFARVGGATFNEAAAATANSATMACLERIEAE